MNIEHSIYTLPTVVLRGLVMFPDTTLSFEAGRQQSINAVDAATAGDKQIFLTTQLDAEEENFKTDNIYKIGTIAVIKQVMKLPSGIVRVLVEGKQRAIMRTIAEDKYFTCEVCELNSYQEDTDEITVMSRQLKRSYEEYFSINKNISPETYLNIQTINSPEKLCNIISHEMPFSYEVKQASLEILNLNRRMEFLNVNLLNETDLAELERKISLKVKKQIDKNQREYYLREQIKAIEDELGEADGSSSEISEYMKKIAALKLKDDVREKLEKEVDRLKKVNPMSSEGGVIRTYLDTVLGLPWSTYSEENLDISHAEQILNEDHFGLEKVKDRILEYLSVRNFSQKASPILCFVGPPGVGKTSVASSVARALGRKYVRVSLGGIHDEADIRGHRKTYIGAMPGRIMNALAQAGTKNPLILLDEIDKVGADYHGDPYAALLEVLDSEQNHSFRDHYTEVPFDLSEVLFITTANTLDTISRPLLDRMEVVEISGYTAEEKLNIAKHYLVLRAISKNGLENKKLEFTDEALTDIINYYTRESGVRGLEREISSLCRKAAKMFLTENRRSIKITSKTLSKMLGKHRYSFDMMNQKDEVGVVRGLAWTAVGGDTLCVEANIMNGTGKIELTGKLGDVMKESAMAAISYIRSASDTLKIKDFHKTKDIHIHVPEGAVPKDGPSAGITMATALISALTNHAVRRDVAMTGEITIRGRVLAIGGLKEKSLAAYRAGIKTVIIPEDNIKDLEDIPQNIREEIKFIPVSSIEQVLKIALV